MVTRKRAAAKGRTAPERAAPDDKQKAAGTSKQTPKGAEAKKATDGAKVTAERPSPGLDDARHAAAQQAAQRAEILRDGYVPACMASALGNGGSFDPHAFRLYLNRVIEDAGNPKSPTTRFLLEQIAFAHLRLADLHAQAAGAKSLEAVKILNGACARLLAEIRRTSLVVDALQDKRPAAPNLRIAKTG